MSRRRRFMRSGWGGGVKVSDFFASALAIRDSYDTKYPVVVASSPPTITVGSPGVASTINGRATNNPATLTANIPNGYTAPMGVGITWVISTLAGAKTFARGGSKRFLCVDAKFDMLLVCAPNAGFGHYFRIRYSEDGGDTFQWGDTGMTSLPDDNGARYILVDFGSAASRIVEFIIMEQTNSSGGNFITAPVAAPDTKPRIMMFGDSYCFGQGSTFSRDSMCFKMGEYLGILDCRNQGLRSNGFAHSSSGLQPYYYQRMDWPTLPEVTQWGTLDLIVINGTLNDNSESAANILSRATLAFRKLRSLQRTALIVFVLQTHTPTSRGSAPNIQAYRDAFDAALGTDPGAILLDSITEDWIPVGATGSSIYFPATGDIDHPNDLGHAYYGEKMGAGVIDLCDRIIAEIPVTGSAILKSDGTSFIFKADGTSKIFK